MVSSKNRSLENRGPTALPKFCGSGFEEYYADPPMTPAEAKEERENIYSLKPAISVVPAIVNTVSRIQACIQRFRARRRISGSDNINLFNQYLFLGGIDTSPRMFGGNTEADVRDMTPEERRDATAIDTVYSSGGGSRFYNADEPEHWDVDFTGIVAGYCSEALPIMAHWHYPRMGKAIGLVENFLTYVLQHGVCPEYQDDVKGALALCSRAKVDLPLAHQALIHFPGQFNLALLEALGENVFLDEGGGFQRPVGFSPRDVIKMASALGVDHGLKEDEALSVVAERECSVDVVRIERPSIDVRHAAQCFKVGGMKEGFSAVGKLFVKPCIIEDGYDDGNLVVSDQKSCFFVDDEILARLRVGFKMQMRVAKLHNGFEFIKQVQSVLVAWHVFLPQTLMVHFKEPVANDKPARSVEDAQADAQGDNEVDAE
ncbi:Argonaute-binding protein 1 [Colletotrichum plurivorum]|uniref:Argonaute-binding protein 1 n=1 Tax=Colletotrichum plurivorum TaxID=2175906 RepID=A0A8H6NCP1_9PEZI|nr:Argonaute-binding protein 1 [Colletotrichum plurivorum]